MFRKTWVRMGKKRKDDYFNMNKLTREPFNENQPNNFRDINSLGELYKKYN